MGRAEPLVGIRCNKHIITNHTKAGGELLDQKLAMKGQDNKGWTYLWLLPSLPMILGNA